MANNNLTGFARVSAKHPSAFAVCDTCGYWFNRVDLVDQVEYQGNEVRRTGFLVCTRTCNDQPQPQLSTPILPPDPIPVRDPRPELYRGDGYGLASTSEPASSLTPVSGLGAPSPIPPFEPYPPPLPDDA